MKKLLPGLLLLLPGLLLLAESYVLDAGLRCGNPADVAAVKAAVLTLADTNTLADYGTARCETNELSPLVLDIRAEFTNRDVALFLLGWAITNDWSALRATGRIAFHAHGDWDDCRNDPRSHYAEFTVPD